MSAKPKPLSGPHKRFADAIFAGKKGYEAYRVAYPKASLSDARKNAHRLTDNDGINAEVARLNAAVNKIVVRKFAWDELDGLNWALGVIRTPIGSIHAKHDLAQESVTTTTREGKKVAKTVRVKMPAKMDAFREIAKIRSWYAPEKIEHSGTVTVQESLARLRTKKWIKKAPGGA